MCICQTGESAQINKRNTMKMLNKIATLTITLITVFGLLVAPAYADGANASNSGTKKTVKKICTTSYGGGTVCNEEVIEEHKTVDTGIAETLVIAGVLFAAGYVTLSTANKISKKNL